MKTLERVILCLLVGFLAATCLAQAYRAGEHAGRAAYVEETLKMQQDLDECQQAFYNSEGGQQ